jgi:DNA-binding SARP family transcriptional activator
VARTVQLLGPVRILAGGEPLALPPSRKVRALLAYLILAGPQTRSRLCDLFWADVPNDPRGELRWALSKLRGLLDDPDRRRVIADDTVSLDLSDCTVDVVTVARTAKTRAEHEAQLACFGGELLEDAADGSAEFTAWLHAQRARFRSLRIAVLAALGAQSAIGDGYLEQWLALAPFDRQAHEAMLGALVAAGRVREAEAHLARAIRAFEQEGLDWVPLRDAWRARRTPHVEITAPVQPAPRPQRASVAIMPLAGETAADGLTDDIITRLAKLRALFVIARGTVYALRDRGIDAEEVARILDIDYLVTGRVRRDGERIAVRVELVYARDARIVWTDDLEGTAAELFGVVDRIVAAIAEEIEAAESNRAVLKPPASLDAWEAYHRGLWHMYKFRGPDNRDASRFFRMALDLDPTFSRAYAGLSFTHFQNAFLDLERDRETEIERAFETAAQSLGADDRDPAAHWAMGRALWLRKAHAESIVELERCIELSPNFALGHYTLGFVQSQTGDPHAAIAATDHSRELSPFDPLMFGMLASRGLAHARLGEYAEGADWTVRAAARPNAHGHIQAVAITCLALADRAEEARALAAKLRAAAPSYGIDDFLRAFHFSPDDQRMFRAAASRIGF